MMDATQQAYELLSKGVFSAWWAAASDALWAYRSPTHVKLLVNPWSVLREAFAAGTFLFRIHYGIHVILRPRAWLDPERRLHHDDGPAVFCPDGTGLYFWHGVRVPSEVVLSPEKLQPKRILSEANAEIRRVMLERYGMDRLVREVGEVIHMSREGVLYELRVPEEREARVMVEVQCPSSGRKYFLRVPPHIRRVHEAIAWTFSLRSPAYWPVQES
jgi:hypothetical protein